MIIKGKLMWHRDKISKWSKKYETTLTQLSPEDVAKLEATGGDVKSEEGSVGRDGLPNKEGYGRYIVCKSKNGLPPAMDAKQHPIPPTLSLGNGTYVKASVNPYDWNYEGRKGISFGCNKIQVLELVEYAGGTDEFGDEDGTDITELGFSNDTEFNGSDTGGTFNIDDIDEEAVA